MFDDALARREVVRLLPGWGAPPLPIHLLCTPERRGAAKVAAFGDHLVAALGDTQPAGRRLNAVAVRSPRVPSKAAARQAPARR
jgi:hypothetical protein